MFVERDSGLGALRPAHRHVAVADGDLAPAVGAGEPQADLQPVLGFRVISRGDERARELDRILERAIHHARGAIEVVALLGHVLGDAGGKHQRIGIAAVLNGL